MAMLNKYLEPYSTEIQVGIDEAGRGCLLGPVFVGAVIWNNDLDVSLKGAFLCIKHYGHQISKNKDGATCT